ncbi:DNA/RNA non-specific endonuclease [Streptomyces sp. ASQP_92]|uniref:DNA/RNA non-specific endonuclease n=1 Tax=Streptomyces sp. ASQP_92 TaxID=2979116 RepID=UPI0021C0979D|nr:DNA/RNA non-specific endonuclease [Streptomyces sp. ASQP_92]MCT9093843.1 DNA/RNA non-specific endonuclease [Streptomyces sp. ASQP_92]
MIRLLSRSRPPSRPRRGKQPAFVKRISLMVAGAVTAGLMSTVPAAATDTPTAPIPLASVAATGDDQVFALAADHSAVYQWSGHGTDWVKVGGPAEDLYAGGAGLFATNRDTHKIYKYNGAPDQWAEIGNPGAEFAVTGDHIYGLNPERDAVYEWNGTGTDWTRIGGPAQDLYAGGAGLFATNRETGNPGAEFAVTGDHLYGLNPERDAVYEWSGQGTDWVKVGGPAQDLYAGGAGLFATNPDTHNIYKYNGQPDGWAQVGEAGRSFAVGSVHLYGLSPEQSAVHQWTGHGTDWTALGAPETPALPATEVPVPPPATPRQAPDEPAEQAPLPDAATPDDELHGVPETVGPELSVTAKGDLYALAPDHSSVWKHEDKTRWTRIGGPAETVHAGRAGVFALNPDTGMVYRYDGEPDRWTRIGESSSDLEVTGDHVYRLSSDHTAVFEWSGQGTTWTEIGGPADQLYAGGAGLFATNPDTHKIYKYNDSPGQWSDIGSPGATFAVSDKHVYGLSPDRTAVFERGSGATWRYQGGPSQALQDLRDEDILRELRGEAYVQEYRQASLLADADLTDWLEHNSAGILLDLIGVKDIEKCLTASGKDKIAPCLLTVANFSTVITVFRKADKLEKAVKTVAVGLPKFRSEVVTARNVVIQARALLDKNTKDLADDFTGHKPERADCRRDGQGWVDLGKRDAANGNRATAMNACLDKTYLDNHKGTDTTPAIRPPGYNWAGLTARYLGLNPSMRINNCHLLGRQLSGSGTDLDNLVTCSRAANYQVKGEEGFANDMEKLESKAKAAVKDGQVVRYTVTPVYSGRRTVPAKIELFAVGMYPDGRPGGLVIERKLDNRIFDPRTKVWRNLGLWVYMGKAVPTGQTP